MTKKISGAEYPLAKIFSSDFEYAIPSYQRPYAWTPDEASDLFDDLYDFYKSEPDEGYFLGSIVLIKEESVPRADVIDGQQRLTTLTILLAAITASLDAKDQEDFTNYLWEPGRRSQGLERKPRLLLRGRDREFFAGYIQNPNLKKLFQEDNTQLTESQKNIKNNAKLISENLEESFGNNKDELLKFGAFVVQRCYLVVVSTSSLKSAFRVFSVMNSRGLGLQSTDIIKADMIGQLTDKEQDEYNERWENMEDELGRGGFNDLFTYIRMIYAKEKAKKSLLDEFRTRVLSKVKKPDALIGDVLEPLASALATVRAANYEAVSDAEEVNTYLKWLNRIDNSDWIPVAILFLSRNKNEPEYMAWFFSRLERLAAFMHVCALNINERIERYNDVIEAVEGEHDLSSPVQAVELTDNEKSKMLEALDGNIYELTPRRRNYLILRLDAFLSDGGASYDSSVLTIEHVLPQTVNDNSEWASLWPDEQVRKDWVHKIANLVPLNQRRNSKAQNYDFEKKKSAYFSGTKGVSSYILTTKVLNSEQWTPEYLAGRQKELLEVLQENWRLSTELS